MILQCKGEFRGIVTTTYKDKNYLTMFVEQENCKDRLEIRVNQETKIPFKKGDIITVDLEYQTYKTDKGLFPTFTFISKKVS